MGDKKTDASLPNLSTDTELNDYDLAGVTGGADDHLLSLGGVKGESKDETHKETIHIESFSRKP